MDARICLAGSVRAWPGPEFAVILKTEIERLDPALLPLQQGLAQSSHVADDQPTAIVFDVQAEGSILSAKVGILYSGIVAGCSCADDPTTPDRITEYCELLFDIDRFTGMASVTLLND